MLVCYYVNVHVCIYLHTYIYRVISYHTDKFAGGVKGTETTQDHIEIRVENAKNVLKYDEKSSSRPDVYGILYVLEDFWYVLYTLGSHRYSICKVFK